MTHGRAFSWCGNDAPLFHYRVQCPLVCAKCWPKYGPSLVKINHRGGPLIATPLNFNVKIKVLWPVLSPNEIEHLLEVLFGHGVELAQAREEINRLPY